MDSKGHTRRGLRADRALRVWKVLEELRGPARVRGAAAVGVGRGGEAEQRDGALAGAAPAHGLGCLLRALTLHKEGIRFSGNQSTSIFLPFFPSNFCNILHFSCIFLRKFNTMNKSKHYLGFPANPTKFHGQFLRKYGF